MALAGDIVRQSLKIIKDVATSYGKDYTTSVAGLLNDAKTIKNDVIKGGKSVGDTLSKIKLNNISKKVSDWFFEKETEYEDYNYDSDSDEFDAGITVDGASSNKEESEEESVTTLDTKSMTRIAKSQAADMYKIGRKQVEQSLANTAEIVTTVNSRSSELLASVNNINKTLLTMSENIASLVKLSAINSEKQEEKTVKKQSITDDSGRLTLGRVWEVGKKNFKLDGNFGELGMIGDLIKMVKGSGTQIGPSDALKFVLDELVMNRPLESLGGKSVGEYAESFNNLIGDTVSNILGEIISDESVKKFFPGMVTGTADRDYSTMVKSNYNNEPAQFDNMVRLTIVDIIPEYLKKINENLSGTAYTVNEHGQLVVEKHEDKDAFSSLLDSTFSTSGISSDIKKSIVDANDNVSSEDVNNASRVLVSVYVMEMHTNGDTFLPFSRLKDSVEECNKAAEILARTGKSKEYWFNLCTVIMTQASGSMTDGARFCQTVNRKLKSLISSATRFAQEDSKQARQATKFSMSMLADRIIGSLKEDVDEGPAASGTEENEQNKDKGILGSLASRLKGATKGNKSEDGKTKADIKPKDGDIQQSSGSNGRYGLIDYARGIFGILNRGINVKTTNPDDNLTGYKPFSLESSIQNSNANNDGSFGNFIGGVLGSALNGEKTKPKEFLRGAISSSAIGDDELISSLVGKMDEKSSLKDKLTSVLDGGRNEDSDALRDRNSNPYSTQDYVRGIFNIVNRGINVRTEDAVKKYQKYDLTHRSMADATDQANSPSGKAKGLQASEYDNGERGITAGKVLTGASTAVALGRVANTKAGKSVIGSIKSAVVNPITKSSSTPGALGSLGNAAKNISGGFKGGNLNPFSDSTLTGKMGNAATRGAYNLKRMTTAGAGIAKSAVAKGNEFISTKAQVLGTKAQGIGASVKDYAIATNNGETKLVKGLTKVSNGLKSGFNSVKKFLTPVFNTIIKSLKGILNLSKKLITSGIANIKAGAKQFGASLFGTRTKKDENGNVIREGQSGLIGNMLKPVTYAAQKANEKILQPTLKASKIGLFGGEFKNSKGDTKEFMGLYPLIGTMGKVISNGVKAGFGNLMLSKPVKSIKKWVEKREKAKEKKEEERRKNEERSGKGINGLASKLSKVFGDSENPLGAFTTSFMKSFKDAQEEKKKAAEKARNAANAKKIESAGDAASLEIKEELFKKEGLLGKCATFLEKICAKVTSNDGNNTTTPEPNVDSSVDNSGGGSAEPTPAPSTDTTTTQSSSGFQSGQSIGSAGTTSTPSPTPPAGAGGSGGGSGGASGRPKGIKGLVTKIMSGAGGSGGAVGRSKGIKGFVTGIMSNFGGMLGGGMSMILGVLQVIAGAVMGLAGFQTLIQLVQSILTEGIKPLNKLFKVIIDTIKPIVSLLTDIVSTVVDTVTSILTSLFDVIAPALGSIVPLLQLISEVLDPILDLIGVGVSKLLTPLVGVVQHIIAPAVKMIVGAIRGILGFVQLISGAVQVGLGHLVSLLGRILEVFTFGAVDGVRKAGEKMIAGGENMYSTGKENVKAAGEEIKAGFKEIFTDKYKDDEDKVPLPTIKPTEISSGGSAMDGVIASDMSNFANRLDDTTGGDTSISNVTTNNDSHDVINNIYGSGDMNQRSYGLAMNMSNRGCGPVALADAYSRRTGSNINPLNLASRMAQNGSYSPNRGTSIDGMVDVGKSLGMNFRVGGVTQQSLKQARPDRPITILGSGIDYGTQSGNNHYVNVVGTDKYGGAYVSNPLSGRVERRSLSTLALNSKLGLYGSGDTDVPNATKIYYGSGDDDEQLFKLDDETQSALDKLKSTAEGLISMFDTSSAEKEAEDSLKAMEEESKASNITAGLGEDGLNELLDKITQAVKDDNHKFDGESNVEYESRIKKIVDSNYNKLIVKYGSEDYLAKMIDRTKIKDAEGNEVDLDSTIKELLDSVGAAVDEVANISVNKYQSQSSGSTGGAGGGTFVSTGGAAMYTPYTPTITETNITSSNSGESPVHEFFGNMAGGRSYSSDGNWYKLRSNPNQYGEGQSGDTHGGIDIQWDGGNRGKPVYAITGGTIISIDDGFDGSNSWGTGGGYGNHIYWKDSAGYTHVYGHLLPGINGAVNTNIEPGALIGYVGNSGSSNGAHLHYTVEDEYGNRINPLTYFKYNPNANNSSMLNVVGDTNEEKFWNYLRWTLNMSPKGAAALMGNFKAESNYATDITEISQRSFLKSHYGLNGEVTEDSLGGDPISKAYHEKLDANLITHKQNDFPNMSDWTHTGLTYNSQSDLSPGYGLIQWTAADRKQGLIEKAQEYNLGIETMQVQLGTVKDELMGDYKWLYDRLMDETQSVRDLADLVRSDYEVTGYHIAERMQYAEEVYNAYKDKPMPSQANTTGFGLVNSAWDAKYMQSMIGQSEDNTSDDADTTTTTSNEQQSSSSNKTSSSDNKTTVNGSYSNTNSNKVNSPADAMRIRIDQFRDMLSDSLGDVMNNRSTPLTEINSMLEEMDKWMVGSLSTRQSYIKEMDKLIDARAKNFHYSKNNKDGSNEEYDFLKGLKESIKKEYGSGDQSATAVYVPPIDESKFESFDFGATPSFLDAMNNQMQNVTQTILSTSSSDEIEKREQERLNKILNNTYNVRSERIEKLLEDIIKKMDKVSSDTNTNVRTNTRSSSMSNMFSDRIPSQIERLYR